MPPTRARVAGVLLAPVAPLTVGVITMVGGDVPTAHWALNVAAALLGVSIAAFAGLRRARAKALGGAVGWGALLVVVALLGATLPTRGIEGVHRWLPLGPVQVHAGALLLPPLLVVLVESAWTTAVVGAFAVLVVLVLQPDAAQAAAFCAAWIGIVAARREKGAAAVIAVSVVLAGACLLRPDPLEPVPHVEGIVGMAAAQGPTLAVAALVSLAVLPLAHALLLERLVGLTLATYTVGLLVAAWLGHHPVPVLGYGVSPILGYYGAVTIAALRGRLGQGVGRPRVSNTLGRAPASATGSGSS